MKNNLLFVIIFFVLSHNSFSADTTKYKFGLTIGGGITSGSFYKNDLGFTTSLGYYFNNNNYLGAFFNSTYINYSYDYNTESKRSEIIGGGLSWRYRGWGNDKYYSVSPGIVAGYWKEDHVTLSNNSGYCLEGITIVDHYYTGLTILTKIGFEHVFLTMDNTLFVNKNTYYLFTLGLEFKNIDLKTLWNIINIISLCNRSPL
ncbi:MAG: hypothetical protein ABSF80_08070 [Chitinispirillaceae bacterium]|jgi:hypothetical protein